MAGLHEVEIFEAAIKPETDFSFSNFVMSAIWKIESHINSIRDGLIRIKSGVDSECSDGRVGGAGWQLSTECPSAI
jgi:hypothetical protein